jgi:hypothetical protein
VPWHVLDARNAHCCKSTGDEGDAVELPLGDVELTMTTLDCADVEDPAGVSGERNVFARAALSLAVLMSEAPEPEVVDVPLRAEIWDSETAFEVLMAVHWSRDEADTAGLDHLCVQAATGQIVQRLLVHLLVIQTCRR